MPKNTRLPGHMLRAEGKPFLWSSDIRRWIRANAIRGADSKEGVALCSCGTASQELCSDAERKRWHRDVHKPQMRQEK